MTGHLLVVGAQRCGTTYLRSLLDAHPEITMARPDRPEPKVFCSDEAAGRGLEWYDETFFAHARDERLLGDKSTSYLEDPAAPGRVAAVLGEPHVVVLLRDPVRRAVSNWRFSTRHGFEDRPLEAALCDNLVRSRPWDPERTSVSPYAYLERGRYLGYLEPWLTAFPATMHVLFLEELVGSDTALADLWAALGVDDSPRPPREEGVNASPGDAPGLSPALVETVQGYFEDSNRALSARLRRDLPWWAGAARGGGMRRQT